MCADEGWPVGEDRRICQGTQLLNHALLHNLNNMIASSNHYTDAPSQKKINTEEKYKRTTSTFQQFLLD